MAFGSDARKGFFELEWGMDEQDTLLEDNAFNGIEEVPQEQIQEENIETDPPEEAPEETVEYAQITKQELEGLLEKASKIDSLESKIQSYWDRHSGTIGELKQKLESNKNRPAFDPEKIKAGAVSKS